MANKKQIKKDNNKKNLLFIGAIAVVIIASAVVIFFPTGSKKSATDITADSQTDTGAKQAVLDDNGDIVINTADITDKVSFFEYDANGTTVGLLAVKTSDGEIHTALNTCQVCNGSPYAYFEQEGDTIQCQNCGNTFSLDEIGEERGGCNPIPVTDENKTESDSQITISAKYLNDNASIFESWKKF